MTTHLIAAALIVAASGGGGAPKTRNLGRIRSFQQTFVVPPSGLRLVFTARTERDWRRPTATATATERSVRDRPAVRLSLAVRHEAPDVSPPRCLEAGLTPPRRDACTVRVGTRWKDRRPRTLELLIERSSPDESPTVEVGISIQDPFE